MRISHVLKHKSGRIHALRADRSLADAVALMAQANIGSVVVLDEVGERPIGIVSEPDVIAAIATRGAIALRGALRSAMRAPAPQCALTDTVADSLARMTRQRIRYLLAVDNDQLAGLVSIGDLVKARLESAELEANVLRDMARSRIAACG